MKKLLLMAALIAGLSGCSKSNDATADTKIEYKFTSESSASYWMTYTDENNSPVQVNFAGTTWTKEISTNKAKGFKWAQFTVGSTSDITTNIHGDIKISVNGKSSFEMPVIFDAPKQSFSYHVVVFN